MTEQVGRPKNPDWDDSPTLAELDAADHPAQMKRHTLFLLVLVKLLSNKWFWYIGAAMSAFFAIGSLANHHWLDLVQQTMETVAYWWLGSRISLFWAAVRR